MPISDAEVDEYVLTLLRHFLDRLSEWEDGFVRSLQIQRERGRIVTDKQRKCLNDIVERVARQHGGTR